MTTFVTIKLQSTLLTIVHGAVISAPSFHACDPYLYLKYVDCMVSSVRSNKVIIYSIYKRKVTETRGKCELLGAGLEPGLGPLTSPGPDTDR